MGLSPATTTLQATTYYIASTLQDILYGVELVLYVKTVHAVLTLEKKQRADVFHLLFSSATFILITVLFFTNAVFSREVCKIHSDHPGGASASTTAWYLALGRAAVFTLQLMSEALLIYRCQAIWNNARVIIVPLILWLATLILGVMVTWMFNTNAISDLSTTVILIALAYFAICVFLNMTLTALICYRLICHGKFVRAELGHKSSSVYFAVAGIVVESALPYTLSGIAFLVALGLRTELLTEFAWVYFMMMCISPQMLILRVLPVRRTRLRQSTSSPSNIRSQHWSEVSMQGTDEPEGKSHFRSLSKVYSEGGSR